MFGYVIPDKLNMFMKDYYGYRGFYCVSAGAADSLCG